MSAPPYAFGVIPARGGSKGLPGKNLRKLGALSLLGQAIVSARESALLTRFIVSTDSEEIAAEAERQGLPAPFLRPAGLATDEAGGPRGPPPPGPRVAAAGGGEAPGVRAPPPAPPLRPGGRHRPPEPAGRAT